YGLSLESDTAAYAGHLRKARELTRQAVDAATRTDNNENAALWLDNAALREAAFGNVAEARALAAQALKKMPTRLGVQIEGALALAEAGDSRQAESLAQS